MSVVTEEDGADVETAEGAEDGEDVGKAEKGEEEHKLGNKARDPASQQEGDADELMKDWDDGNDDARNEQNGREETETVAMARRRT